MSTTQCQVSVLSSSRGTDGQEKILRSEHLFLFFSNEAGKRLDFSVVQHSAATSVDRGDVMDRQAGEGFSTKKQKGIRRKNVLRPAQQSKCTR